ncbi:hypothetical protein MUK42_25898 [Musa troglodytarum]|uniref:Uncharacterized protein n=1 Tax=Musa troglodytarum TaxID=320322 RepID=A0A9E7EE42_9LILI|nr:hypothetical protein MUK42_25898 [Musa troglodytarum]
MTTPTAIGVVIRLQRAWQHHALALRHWYDHLSLTVFPLQFSCSQTPGTTISALPSPLEVAWHKSPEPLPLAGVTVFATTPPLVGSINKAI